ncbi:Basement membrane-specific heparan sulfate proteoglycan core protein [Mactra antiquata]
MAKLHKGTSPGSTVGLNLKLPLFLGGADPTISVSENTGVTRGFIGCVAELTVNDRKYDLINDAIESVNIVDCGERRLCEREPCKNNGICEDLPGPDYRCLCPSTHTGKLCEIKINICLTNSPCQNGSPCSITNDGYRCDCILGFAGDHCDQGLY